MGVLMGYGMTAIIGDWRLSFFIQGMINCTLTAVMFIVPKHYVNINEALEAKKTEVERRKTVPEMGGTGQYKQSGSATTADKRDMTNTGGIGQINEVQNSSQSLTDDLSSLDLNLPKTTWETIEHMMKNRAYIFLVLSLTCAFYLITTLQYWITDYLISVINGREQVVFKIYCFCTFTAPAIGAIISG
jgi:hypothetical protein